jgi:hypothetical protein
LFGVDTNCLQRSVWVLRVRVAQLVFFVVEVLFYYYYFINYITGRTVHVPTMFMTAVINNPDRAVVPCKEILGEGGFLRPPGANIMQGYVPARGNQHGGKLGMGSTPQHRINTPLMPQANSFYAYLNSDLGKARSLRVKNGRVVKKNK